MMETNYLASPLAIAAGAVICVAFAFAYLWIEPRLNPRKIISRRGEIRWTPGHDGWRVYFDLHFILIMVMVTLLLLVGPPWKWPISLDNLIYDVFLIRVGGSANTAHIWTYMTIPAVFFIAWHLTKNIWRSFLSAALMVFTHEGIWYLYLYAATWQTIYWTDELWADTTFLMIICTFALVYASKYKLNRSFLIVVGPQLLYDFCWYLIGFPVTTTNSRSQMVTYGATKWASVVWVNAIECVGWWLILTCTLIWLRYTAKRCNQTRTMNTSQRVPTVYRNLNKPRPAK